MACANVSCFPLQIEKASRLTNVSPYYVFLGCSRSRSTEQAIKAFEVETGNTVGSDHATPLGSPLSPFIPGIAGSPASVLSSTSTVFEVPPLDLGPAALPEKRDSVANVNAQLAFPLSSFHYQSRYVPLYSRCIECAWLTPHSLQTLETALPRAESSQRI